MKKIPKIFVQSPQYYSALGVLLFVSIQGNQCILCKTFNLACGICKRQYMTFVCMFVCMYASRTPELLCPCVKGSKGQFVRGDTEQCDTWANDGHSTHSLYTNEYTVHIKLLRRYSLYTVEYKRYTVGVGYTLYSLVCPGGMALCTNIEARMSIHFVYFTFLPCSELSSLCLVFLRTVSGQGSLVEEMDYSNKFLV